MVYRTMYPALLATAVPFVVLFTLLYNKLTKVFITRAFYEEEG
jgi:hypothetical protein